MAISTKLGSYPDIYLRTIIMKRNLLVRPDYDKLLKMSPGEIGKYLEDFEYKKEVDELGMKYQGTELIERTLQLSLGNKFDKLLRICPLDIKLLIKIYQKRYDVYNIKVILRAKLNNLSAEDTKNHMNPVSVAKNDFFERLIAQKTVEEVISSLNFLDEGQIRASIDHFKNNQSLLHIENMLDKHYFSSVISQLTFLKEEGKLYKKFLLKEIDVLNVKLLLRLKREGISEQDIKELIVGYGTLKKFEIDKMLKSDVTSIIKELENTQFKEIAEKYSKEAEVDFTDLEMSLDKFLLEQSRKLIKQHPLSVDVILGYMFLKDLEVKNLTRIIKAKQLGMEESFIEKIILI